MLEVLSLGIPVVMSRTGGNKYFEQFKQPGLKFYNTLEEAKNSILEIKKMPALELYDAKQKILEMFREEFTVEQFAKNYVRIISEIAIFVIFAGQRSSSCITVIPAAVSNGKTTI